MAHPIKIFLVDDHAIVREGTTVLINAQQDMEVIGQAANMQDLLQHLATSQPHVIIMDIAIPGENGITGTERLRQAFPTMRVLILTRYREAIYIQKMLHAGVQGYVLKQAPADELLTAIRTIAAGATYFNIATEMPRVNQNALATTQELLSERERIVLQLIAHGYSNKEIAAQLNINIKSVETYKARATEKLGLYSRAEIVRHALKHGWFDF